MILYPEQPARFLTIYRKHGDNLKKQNNYKNILSTVLCLLSSAFALIFSHSNLNITILLIGLFFITKTSAGFANSRRSKQILTALTFGVYLCGCIFCNTFFMCFLFLGVYADLCIGKSPALDLATQTAVPPIVYILVQALYSNICADACIRALIIFSVSLIYSVIYYASTKFFIIKEQMNRSAANFAIAEVRQKNLNDEIAVQNTLIERNARLEERENISRDIHNSVGHTVMASIIALDAADMLCDVDIQKAHDKIKTARSRMSESMENVRTAVRLLDDGISISCEDFRSLLTITADRFVTDTDINIHHNFDEIEGTQFDKYCCEFINSVMLECLSNGIKHGHATLFTVIVEVDSANIRMTVSDNGTGFGDISDSEKHQRLTDGFGLKKIRSYCQRHGGKFYVNSDEGFTVSVSLPINTKNGGNYDE